MAFSLNTFLKAKGPQYFIFSETGKLVTLTVTRRRFIEFALGGQYKSFVVDTQNDTDEAHDAINVEDGQVVLYSLKFGELRFTPLEEIHNYSVDPKGLEKLAKGDIVLVSPPLKTYGRLFAFNISGDMLEVIAYSRRGLPVIGRIPFDDLAKNVKETRLGISVKIGGVVIPNMIPHKIVTK